MLQESEAELAKNAGVLDVLRIKLDQFREENEQLRKEVSERDETIEELKKRE
jgi:FtsZ-binding cell division protein ZapB